jgi:hypothetical protein
VSFSTKKRNNGKEYVYFKAGGKGPYYIAPKDSPSTVNVENVEKALRYMETRFEKDKATIEKLISYLPKDKRQEYRRMLE